MASWAFFEEAGARILPNACGICAGYGNARLGEEYRCISSTARNFKGRMGAASSKVWLASPLTVAASALEGGSPIRARILDAQRSTHERQDLSSG